MQDNCLMSVENHLRSTCCNPSSCTLRKAIHSHRTPQQLQIIHPLIYDCGTISTTLLRLLSIYYPHFHQTVLHDQEPFLLKSVFFIIPKECLFHRPICFYVWLAKRKHHATSRYRSSRIKNLVR